VSKRVCVVTGVGPGTGSALVRRFAAGGYQVAMLARSEGRLRELAAETPGASAYPCDVADEVQVAATLARIVRELGPASVVVHNAVGGAFGDFQQIEPAGLQRNFASTHGPAAPRTCRRSRHDRRGGGRDPRDGNTSAYRGRANFAGFAPTKAAQRVLAESLARSLGPRSIHVAYLAIDAVIDVPWARQQFRDKPDDFFAKPSAIADVAFGLAHQDRSAWAFDVVVRPFCEPW
jgi:NAD(P)-dependent dehydrogenase (short-subunit alcohol dehydrogenase family)